MLNCHYTTFLMSQRQERKLSTYERIRLRLHAAICPACVNFEQQLPSLRAAARALATHDDEASE